MSGHLDLWEDLIAVVDRRSGRDERHILLVSGHGRKEIKLTLCSCCRKETGDCGSLL